MTAKQVLSALREVAREDKAAFLRGFFQAGPGGYGEGDRFLGCVVLDQRKVARQFRDLSRNELVKLFASPWHECRLTGMLILVGQYELAAKPKNPHRNFECGVIVEFYLANLDAVNNWDIVDTTAPKILGAWLVDHPDERSILDRLVESDVLWERRVAVLATLSLIRND
jgi:3-methyladenine DNA glycosylase AlkD